MHICSVMTFANVDTRVISPPQLISIRHQQEPCYIRWYCSYWYQFNRSPLDNLHVFFICYPSTKRSAQLGCTRLTKITQCNVDCCISTWIGRAANTDTPCCRRESLKVRKVLVVKRVYVILCMGWSKTLGIGAETGF